MPIDIVFDPPVPADGKEVFKTKAQGVFANLNPWAAQANALAVGVNDDAQAADQSAQDADQRAQDADQSRASAQQAVLDANGWANVSKGHADDAANAAYSVATQWAPGSYTENQVVWLNASAGSLYRCIAAVTSATQPNIDEAHWVYVGPAPEALPAATSYTYSSGRVTEITEDGVTTTITYHADGKPDTVSYPHNGKTRIETYSYSGGQVAGITATEV